VKLSETEVIHVATLAGLALSKEEVGRMVHEISAILDYVEGLAGVDTKGLEESLISQSPTVLASDEIIPSLPVDRALANAPDRAGSFFQVPRILEEGR
jgi:aspartyl-tRNA(Asn)/glutamyl-tRNA(Gln) amidotransferase subunit C